MKKAVLLSCVLFFGTGCFGSDSSRMALIYAAQHGAEGMITLRVLDDEGRSINTADILANFPKPLFNQGVTNWITDTNGLCVLDGIATDDIVYSITKRGYYETRGWYAFSRQKMPMVINGRWQPWNQTNTVVLKRIKNSVPMYVKKVETVIPVLNQPIGFDLEKGDWVPPYGKGVRADMFFFATGKFGSNLERNSFLEITFPNQKDGIKTFEIPVDPEFNDRSMFASPYFSPESGYATNWIYERKITPTREGRINPSPRENMNFFFRTQTVLNENEKIISAKYGKIYGDIVCDFADEKNLGVYFTYYLNSTSNDRNIEFDPDKNLFGGRNRFAP